MKLLKRIELKNFQSHEYSDIYLHDKVNVIIGPSDSGKTAIIRGVKWVLFNEPSGNDFMRKGTNDTSVTLYFSNNLIVKRGRTKSKNYYELTLPTGTVERFEGFGREVPEEVKELTGIKKVKLDGNNLVSLSVSDQLESPFLLTESPSIKAVAIGKIAGVETIDLALGKLSKDIRNIENQKKSLEKEQVFQESKLKEYDFLGKEEEELAYIQDIIEKIKRKKQLLDNMKSIYEGINRVNANINSHNNILDNYKNINILEEYFNKLSLRINKYKLIKSLFLKYEYLSVNILKESFVLKSTENIDLLEELLKKLSDITIKYNKILIITEQYDSLNKNINKYNLFIEGDNSINLEEKYIQLTKLTERYNVLLIIFEKLAIIDKRIDNGNVYITKLENIDSIENMYNLANNNVKKLNKIIEYNNLQKNIYMRIEENTENLINIESNFKKYINKYINLLKKSSVCPYCHGSIDDKHFKKIISEYEV